VNWQWQHALLNVGSDIGAAFAAVSVVVAVRNDSVGWLVASSLGLLVSVVCSLAKQRAERD
jgi:hypothetical protein